MALRIAASILLQFVWLHFDSPSNVGQRHSQEGRRGWVHQAGLGWIIESSVFAVLVTNCLRYVSGWCLSTRLEGLLFNTSKQILPSLSIFGW